MWSPEDDDNPGVLEFQGRKYAVGLLWLVTSEDEKKTLRRRRIKKADADFYCIRNHISRQVGFGWLAKGHRRHMPVGAIVVADQLVGEWHGVFQADNGWWYLQVRGDAIAPNGDQFFLAESDAYAIFHENLAKQSWPHSYAPVHWNVTESSREMTLARLLDEGPAIGLQPTGFDAAIGGAQNRNLLIAVVFAMIMAAVMIYAFSNLWEVPDEPVSAPKQAPIPTLAQPKNDKVEVPSPVQVMTQCQGAMEELFQPVTGWNFKEMVCAGNVLSMTWQHTQSNAIVAQQNIRSVPQGDSVLLQGSMVTVKKNLGRPSVIEQKNLMTVAEATLKVQDTFNRMGELKVQTVTPPPPPPPPSNALLPGQPPPVPLQPRPYMQILLRTTDGPSRMKSYLDLNALELTSVKWDIPNGMWTYEMKLTLERPPANTTQAP